MNVFAGLGAEELEVILAAVYLFLAWDYVMSCFFFHSFLGFGISCRAQKCAPASYSLSSLYGYSCPDMLSTLCGCSVMEMRDEYSEKCSSKATKVLLEQLY